MENIGKVNELCNWEEIKLGKNVLNIVLSFLFLSSQTWNPAFLS